MKIYICASKYCYPHVARAKKELEDMGHDVTVPNSYDNPMKEEEIRNLGAKAHQIWKAGMLREQGEKVAANDAILVLNMEKNGQQHYIGGATFLEIFKAFELGKKIFLYNPIPENLLRDELLGMNPTIVHGDLTLMT